MRHLLISVDARAYGSATGREQADIQRGLLEVLDRAAERTGLARHTWTRQPAGDGELAILPAYEPEPETVADFPRHLADELRMHNRHILPGHRLRLRLAIHHGVARPAPNGHAGAGPVAVSRLCDSPQLKAALAESGADLAVIFSGRIFLDTIREEHTPLRPEDMREVHVVQKEFDEPAWIWIPGHPVPAVPAPAPQPEEVPPPERSETLDAVICFARHDAAIAERLALALHRRGLNVYIDPWAEPGQVLLLERERAIDTAPNGILLFSTEALQSDEICDDYAALLGRVRERTGHRFVPVRVEDVPLPRFAAIRKPLDLIGEQIADHRRIDLLVRALRADQ